MKRLIQLLIVTLMVAALSGCYRHTFRNASGNPQSRPAVTKWQSHFLWGLASGDDINLNEACPQGVWEVYNSIGLLQAVVGSLTLGIYTPSYVEVTCKEAG